MIAFGALAVLLAAIAIGYLGFRRLQKPLMESVAQQVTSDVTSAFHKPLGRRKRARHVVGNIF